MAEGTGALRRFAAEAVDVDQGLFGCLFFLLKLHCQFCLFACFCLSVCLFVRLRVSLCVCLLLFVWLFVSILCMFVVVGSRFTFSEGSWMSLQS
jgi:hypothetical protein